MKTLIRIGHPAYRGINGSRFCFSKAQAVRVLRMRGIPRDTAREVIRMTFINGGHYAGEPLSCIETSNMAHPSYQGCYMERHAELKAIWRGYPEA